MKPNLFSLTAHENMNFLHKQIENILNYNPGDYIIVHLSTTLKDTPVPFQFPNVFINPSHLSTQWGYMWHAQFSNIEFIRKIGLDYSYIIFEASNTLYFKSGSNKYMSSFDAGFTTRTVEKFWNKEAEIKIINDFTLISIIGHNKPIQSNHEGTFYKKELIEQIYDLLSQKYKMPHQYVYNIEEIWFPNVCRTLTDKIGLPLTIVTSLLRPLSWNEHFNIPYSGSAIGKEKILEFKSTNSVPFAIKGVQRNLNDEFVKWILNL